MNLPDNIVKKFATTVNESNNTPADSTYFGTTVVQNNTTYVKIDGSSELTPVTVAADAKDGDRVVVSIENHSAKLTVNLTNPASGYSASNIYNEETGKVNDAFIRNLFAENITATGTITGVTLSGTKGVIGGFNIQDYALYTPGTKVGLDTEDIAGVYLGVNGIEVSGDKGYFKATSAGDVSAHNISMTGNLTWSGEDASQYVNFECGDPQGGSLVVSGNSVLNGHSTLELYGGTLTLEDKTAGKINLTNIISDVDRVSDSGTSSKAVTNVTHSMHKLIATISSVGTSDSRLKTDITDITNIENFYMSLSPKKFKFRSELSGYDPLYHYGLIAQDVLTAMTDNGFDITKQGIVWTSDPEELFNEQNFVDDKVLKLQKDELHAFHIMMIQSLNNKVKQLEARITELEGSNAK